MRPEMALARLAANQHGVASLDQLLAVGLGPEAISRRVRAGRLHRIHRGVYAVGHTRLSYEGRCKAAVLACGPAACLSHRAAGILWRLLPAQPNTPEVTVPGHGGRRKRKGIRIYRSVTLAPADTTLRAGIAITTPARTLADLRRLLDADAVAHAHRRAEVCGYRLDGLDLGEPEPTRSELERRFLRLCRAVSLPSPEVNVSVGEYVVDFLWRDHSLIVETDGYRYHRGRVAFEHDHRRQAILVARGFEVLRFTWSQVANDRNVVIAVLRARLGQQKLQAPAAELTSARGGPPPPGVRARRRTPPRSTPRP